MSYGPVITDIDKQSPQVERVRGLLQSRLDDLLRRNGKVQNMNDIYLDMAKTNLLRGQIIEIELLLRHLENEKPSDEESLPLGL